MRKLGGSARSKEAVQETPKQQEKVGAQSLGRSQRLDKSMRLVDKGVDVYAQEMQSFVDGMMKSIAQKIAEKKAIELASSKLQAALAGIQKETKKESDLVTLLTKKLDQESLQVKKREQENARDLELIKAIEAKKNQKNGEITTQLDLLRQQKAELQGNIAKQKEDLGNLRAENKRRATSLKQQLLATEHATVEATYELEKLYKQTTTVQQAETERLRILKEKSKMLNALILSEGLSGSNTPIQRDIAKILRSPSKTQSPSRPQSQLHSPV
jgi:hypothetical protein